MCGAAQSPPLVWNFWILLSGYVCVCVCEKSLLLKAGCLLGYFFFIEKCFFGSCGRGKKKLALLRNPIFYQEIETSHLAACSSAVPWVSACRALRYPCLVPGFCFLLLTRIPSVAVKGQHWRQSQCYPETSNFANRLEILVVAGIDAAWVRPGGWSVGQPSLKQELWLHLLHLDVAVNTGRTGLS